MTRVVIKQHRNTTAAYLARHSSHIARGKPINNMVYPVQFVARALADAESDGHEIVFAGRVVLIQDHMLLFEYDEFNNNNATPAFSTYLSNVKRIKCRPLRSGHGSYTGGVVRIFGVFDRFVSERLTLKIGQGYYRNLLDELKAKLN
jgi:hypothetical protein